MLTEKRTPEVLKRQVERFLENLGGVEALALILKIDPLFSAFMKEECGLHLDLIKELSIKAREAAETLVRHDGIVTEENIARWMKSRKGQEVS